MCGVLAGRGFSFFFSRSFVRLPLRRFYSSNGFFFIALSLYPPYGAKGRGRDLPLVHPARFLSCRFAHLRCQLRHSCGRNVREYAPTRIQACFLASASNWQEMVQCLRSNLFAYGTMPYFWCLEKRTSMCISLRRRAASVPCVQAISLISLLNL